MASFHFWTCLLYTSPSPRDWSRPLISILLILYNILLRRFFGFQKKLKYCNFQYCPEVERCQSLPITSNHLPITSKNGDQSRSNHLIIQIKNTDRLPSTYMDNAVVVVSVHCFYTSESFPTDRHVSLVLNLLIPPTVQWGEFHKFKFRYR